MNKELFDSKFIDYLLKSDNFILDLVEDDEFCGYFADRFEANYDVMGKQIKRKSVATIMAVNEVIGSNFGEYLRLTADKHTIKEILDEQNYIKGPYDKLLNEYCKRLVPKLTRHKVIQEIIEEISTRIDLSEQPFE